jgi:hypothetical protein
MPIDYIPVAAAHWIVLQSIFRIRNSPSQGNHEILGLQHMFVNGTKLSVDSKLATTEEVQQNIVNLLSNCSTYNDGMSRMKCRFFLSQCLYLDYKRYTRYHTFFILSLSFI